MSKTCRSILPVFAGLLVTLFAFGSAVGQDIEVTLIVDADRSTVQVKGRFLNATPSSTSQPLVFLSDYAGIRLPHNRIKNVKHSGLEWSYEVDLTPLKSMAAMAHISWLTKDSGIFMLKDLLPISNQKNRVQTAKVLMLRSRPDFSGLPWVITSEKRLNDGTYLIADTDKAVLLLHFAPVTRDGPHYSPGVFLGVNGTFQFIASEALDVADEIHRRYWLLFRTQRPDPVIGLANRPNDVQLGIWEADTRGSTITIVSSDTTFKSQSLQRLHEQLRHEMFHLWIPEGVNLSGNYDWFYEGFALYQSLKLGVAVNRLRFEDYLDSLTQAYAIDRRLGGKMSLIDAAKNRWSGDNSSAIYARGMLVAFLSDLAMLEVSTGKRSTDNIVREVYQKHSGTAAKQDGNAAVIAILKQRPELVPIVERYVTGSEKLDWTPFLSAAGLEATGPNRTALTTVAKPNSGQKKLLDKLGYNNWRKLSPTRK